MKMSDGEDTKILLNNAGQIAEAGASKLVVENPVKKPGNSVFKKNDKNSTLWSVKRQNLIISAAATLSGTAFGYDMGVGKQIAPFVETYLDIFNCNLDVTFCSWFMGAYIGSFLGGILVDKCGRRTTMILALTCLSLGSLLSAFANSSSIFVLARLLCGLSGITSAMSHCVYVAEVSDPKKRGRNVSLHQLGIALGLLLSVIFVASRWTSQQWPFFAGFTAIPALASLLATAIFLQPSPTSLLLQRKLQGAKPVLKNSRKPVLETLGIMVFAMVLQQATGRQQVLFYAPRLFGLLGICSNVAQVTTSIALGIVKLFSSALALVVVERCGRRTALITSATICMTTISLLALLATLDRSDDTLILARERCKSESQLPEVLLPLGSPPPFPLLPTPLAVSVPITETWTQVRESCETQNVMTSEGLSAGLRILAVITLLVYESAYSLGLGTVPFVTLSEVFPSRIRGRCIGYCIMMLWIFHFTFSESVVSMTRTMTLAGTYLLYSFLCLIMVCYVFLFYPETKGKTLAQIAQEIRKISPSTRVCNNLRSLPVICYFDRISKFWDKKNSKGSTLI